MPSDHDRVQKAGEPKILNENAMEDTKMPKKAAPTTTTRVENGCSPQGQQHREEGGNCEAGRLHFLKSHWSWGSPLLGATLFPLQPKL